MVSIIIMKTTSASKNARGLGSVAALTDVRNISVWSATHLCGSNGRWMF
jgi:hypothetical protein